MMSELTPYQQFQLDKYGNILPEPNRIIVDERTGAERFEHWVEHQYEVLFLNEENTSI